MIVGAIVGATLATAGSSFAATAFETLKATVRPDYKIVVDGKDAKLNNKPVTIDGSTYLPIREVATLLNKDVNFKSSTNTITLTTKNDTEIDKISINTLGTPFEIGKTTFTVNSYKYIENTKHPQYSEKFFIAVNFDVTVSDNQTNVWRGIHFLSHVNVANQKINVATEENSNLIYPNVTERIEILFPVSEKNTVTSINFKDPVSGNVSVFEIK